MMLVPSTTIEPRSGRRSPIRDFRNTDLPVPEGPSRTLTSPTETSTLTAPQSRWGPKDLVNPSTWIPMPTRDPSAKCCPRHLPPACGLSHCSLRRSAATLVRGHILGACKYDCGADLFARSTPQCAFVGTADVCVCRHRRRVRLSAPPTCAFVGTADVCVCRHRRRARKLLDGDRRACGLELGLGLLGGLLGDLLEQRLGGAVDQILGLLELLDERRELQQGQFLERVEQVVGGQLGHGVVLPYFSSWLVGG